MVDTNFTTPTNVKKIVEQKGKFYIIEYSKDLSVNPSNAVNAYFSAQMNIRKRQVAILLQNNSSAILQAGAMQWMAGDINVETNVKGIGNLIGKALSAKVTKETIIKPKYTSPTEGLIVLEPTYKHLLLEDVEDWGDGMVIGDKLFLACDATVNIGVVSRDTLSSAVLGNEGLFNSVLSGKGVAVLESNIPRDELVLVELSNDKLKIDGSYAIAWSKSLKFTVERTTKTLIGSAASGEGLVNVYSGTGKVLLAPI